MRLTLRTLLAYLDGVLKPEDAEDIAQKLKESKYAADLAHRVRELMRRERLGSPGVADRGPGMDANSVAEYLDNVLPVTEVAEFEKLCLESDIHLAEAAACHQILKLIQSVPADFSIELRDQLYDLPKKNLAQSVESVETVMAVPLQSESTIVSLDEPVAVSSADSRPEPPLLPPLSDRKQRLRPTIPEYLRDENRKRFSWGLAFGIAVLALGLAILLMAVTGQFEPGQPLGNALVRLGLIKMPDTLADKTPASSSTTSSSPSTPIENPTTAPPVEAKENVDTGTTSETNPPPAQKGTEPKKNDSTDGGPLPASTEDKNSPATSSGSESNTGEGNNPDSLPPGDGTLPKEPPKTDTKTTEGGDETNDTNVSTPVPPAPKLPSIDNTGNGVEKSVITESLGRLLSNDQVLIRHEPQSRLWNRIAPKDTISTGLELISLPTYRPEILYPTSMSIELMGGAKIELLPRTENRAAGIKIDFGRLIITPLSDAPAEFQIVTPSRNATVTFLDPKTKIALDIHRMYRPGLDPRAEDVPYMLELYVLAGRVSWNEMAQQIKSISAPSCWLFRGDKPGDAATMPEPPKWIAGENISQLDRKASQTLFQNLVIERPADIVLKELAQHRQREIRKMAVRALGYLNSFEHLATALNDEEMRSDWPQVLEQLREAIARDALTASQVQVEMEKKYSADGEKIFRMLWGYNDKDLANGEDKILVENLENPLLAVRVLAILNLKEITGQTNFYEANATENKRQAAVVRWRGLLENSKIRFQSSNPPPGETPAEEASPAP